MNIANVSVIVTGAPAQLRMPKTLPGETKEQFTIRTNPQHWRNCIERLKRQLNLKQETCDRLLRGDLEGHDKETRKQIHEFLRWRWPQTGRTFDSLAVIRDALATPPLTTLVETPTRIIQVICPKVHKESNDGQFIQICEEYGVEIIWLNSEERESFFVEKVLPRVKGNFLWVVPGTTRSPGSMAALLLAKIMNWFGQNPAWALFSDQTYTTIYRTEAIRDVLKRERSWPNEGREQAQILRKCGYQFIAQKMNLFELEEMYGGNPAGLEDPGEYLPAKPGKQSLWNRIFGK